MFSNHCIAHRLHLAAEDATKQVSYFTKYKEIVKSIYNFFSNSYKRWYQLKQIQENSEYSDLNILNIIETRWLSQANVINNFHQIIDDVHSALIQNNDNPIAKYLADSLDIEFYIFTKFLADILGTISSMIKVFQSDYVSLSETQHQLSMVIETITSDFISTQFSEPHYGNYLSKFMDENALTGFNLSGKKYIILK